MLVLCRKRGEAVVIGGDVEIHVLEVRGERVKLGIVGPAEIPVHRAEVQRRIASESAGRRTVPRDYTAAPHPGGQFSA